MRSIVSIRPFAYALVVLIKILLSLSMINLTGCVGVGILSFDSEKIVSHTMTATSEEGKLAYRTYRSFVLKSDKQIDYKIRGVFGTNNIPEEFKPITENQVIEKFGKPNAVNKVNGHRTLYYNREDQFAWGIPYIAILIPFFIPIPFGYKNSFISFELNNFNEVIKITDKRLDFDPCLWGFSSNPFKNNEATTSWGCYSEVKNREGKSYKNVPRKEWRGQERR